MNKLAENPDCPICKSKRYLELLYRGIASWEYKGVFSLVQCRKCNLVFQSPRDIKEEVNKYYVNEKYWYDSRSTFTQQRIKHLREKKFGRIYRHLFSQNNSFSILDVGSGSSIFLSGLVSPKIRFNGIDISQKALEIAERLFKISLIKTDILDFKPKQKYDYISFLNVLEHVYAPLRDLKKANQLLKKDGELILATPNINSLGHFLFKKDWFQFQPGRHLYYYSPETIKKILELAGFQITGIDHINWEDNYYSIFQSFRFKYSQKFIKGREGGLIHENNKTSKFTLLNEIKKMLAKIITTLIVYSMQILKKSDVIVVYARKENH